MAMFNSFRYPHDGPGPMDRPSQGDFSAGYMEGQIVGIACGSVGAPLQNMRGADYNNNKRYIVIHS